jgi:hypothetical protein
MTIPYNPQNKEYLALYQKLGLRDPKEFYFESVVRNFSCDNKLAISEYRRQTGKSTEILVWAIYCAMYLGHGSDIISSQNNSTAHKANILRQLLQHGKIKCTTMHDSIFTISENGKMASITLRTRRESQYVYSKLGESIIFDD